MGAAWPGLLGGMASGRSRLRDSPLPAIVVGEATKTTDAASPQDKTMKRKERTLEEVEAFADRLAGPLGKALRAVGAISERRLRERGQEWSDLSDVEVVDLFVTALMQTVPEAYPSIERKIVEDLVSAMADNIYLELAANAEGSASKT